MAEPTAHEKAAAELETNGMALRRIPRLAPRVRPKGLSASQPFQPKSQPKEKQIGGYSHRGCPLPSRGRNPRVARGVYRGADLIFFLPHTTVL